MKLSTRLLIGSLCVAGVIALTLTAWDRLPRHAQASYHCTAGLDEKCATEKWYASYQRLVALNDELHPKPKLTEAEIEKKTDEQRGLIARLAADIPQPACTPSLTTECWNWDGDNLKFEFIRKAAK